MKIYDVHRVLDRCIQNDWVSDWKEGEEKEEVFADALQDMHDRAGGNEGAVYAFFTFAAGQVGADHDWEPEEMSERFNTSYRASGRTEAEVIHSHFESDSDGALYLVAVEYAKSERPDLDVQWYMSTAYLFEGE